MNICVFDTETVGLEKPFCYDIGYIIINTETWEPLVKRSYIVEQVWYNLPLFNTAYYAEKRPLYVSALKGRRAVLEKFGYICRKMSRDFKEHEVKMAFAFNSPFDEKVFNYNCDWYKCGNPFDDVEIKDIRGFAHWSIIDETYKAFCDEFGLYTENGNYSTTAESIFRYLLGHTDFNEAHTALADSEIESEILRVAIQEYGLNLEENFKPFRSIPRLTEKTLHIQTAEQTDYFFDYTKIRINKEKTEIKLN